MGANSIGRLLTLSTFGESHGEAIGGILDGCPAGFMLDIQAIQDALDKRRPGQSHYTTQRREADAIQILSGLYQGKTLGTPIAFIIQNTDARSKDYDALSEVFRPGHGDYSYDQKYGHRDPRGGGRASARETAVRVAAGAIAEQWLATKGITIRAALSQMGEIKGQQTNWSSVRENPFFALDAGLVPQMADKITTLRRAGDSVGARVVVEAHGVPAGLGEPIYHKLQSELGAAFFSINAVKAVGFGAGHQAAEQTGSEHRDRITQEGFDSNHAGGILAGISTGQVISAEVTFKPPSSIPQPIETLNRHGEMETISVGGRHDPCVGIRGVPVVQAMMALVLMDHYLVRYGQTNEP